MLLTIHTDGGSLNNPGPSACSYIISNQDNTILDSRSFFLGFQTNNIAEYSGIKKALIAIIHLKKSLHITALCFISDSLLMVNQLNGVYKVKDEGIRSFVFDIRILEQQVGVPIKYTHVLREFNKDADALVKETLLSYHS